MFKYIYMTTPTSVFMTGPKEAKNGTLAADLIYDMYTQLDFGSNIGGILLATPLPIGV